MILTLALVLTLAQPASDTPATSPSETPARVSAKDKAAARALLREGTRLFARGKHGDALARFNRAYELFPSPKLLYNIAQANRELGRNVEALSAFEAFLAQTEKPPARLAADVRRAVAELQAQLAKLEIQVDVAGADLSLDEKLLGQAPLPEGIWVSPGPHEVAARKDGFLPTRKSIDARAGGVEQVELTLAPITRVAAAAPAPAPQSAPAPIYKRPWFWVGVGAAVVAGTVAAMAW